MIPYKSFRLWISLCGLFQSSIIDYDGDDCVFNDAMIFCDRDVFFSDNCVKWHVWSEYQEIILITLIALYLAAVFITGYHRVPSHSTPLVRCMPPEAYTVVWHLPCIPLWHRLTLQSLQVIYVDWHICNLYIHNTLYILCRCDMDNPRIV